MKNLTSTLMAAVAALLLIAAGNVNAADAPKTYNDLRVGVMHPWEMSEGEGTCEICGMALSEVHGHTPGTPAPPIDSLYIDPDNAMWVHEGAGMSPNGKPLIPITESPFYEPPKEAGAPQDTAPPADQDMSGMDMGGKDVRKADTAPKADSGKQLWTCGMHPNVIEDHPGLCPICHMELIPLKNSTATSGGAQVRIDPVTLQNIGVVSEAAKRRDLSQEIRTNGTVEVAEDRESTLTARVSGYVEKLYVDRTGDPVRKGQPLVAIYSPDLVTAQQEYLLALRNADAMKKTGVAALQKNADDLLAAARKRLELWEISDDQIETLAKNGTPSRTMTLVSPASGYVLKKNVVEGDAVKAGTDLFSIGNLNRIWVSAQVYEFELPWVRQGDKVVVTSPYDPTLTLDGTVDYIYPTLDAKSRTANVRIVLANNTLALKPEMWVDVRILAAPKVGALSVPKSAVIRSGQRDIVFVDEGEGLFEPRLVQVGVEAGPYYEILGGLHAGEKVVTSAQFLLDSEAKLQEAIQRRIAAKSSKNAVAAAANGSHNH